MRPAYDHGEDPSEVVAALRRGTLVPALLIALLSSAAIGVAAGASAAPTAIRVQLPVVNGTAPDNSTRMRQYWQAELGLRKTYDRRLIWRLASPSVRPGRIKFGSPRSVVVGGGSAWGPGVDIWWHPVTVTARDGRKAQWVLVTVQEWPGESERLADLLPLARLPSLHSQVHETARPAAAKVVERYFEDLVAGRVAAAKSLMAPQSGGSPDLALRTATQVHFEGGTVDRVGRASFYDLCFGADVRYPEGAPRRSGGNTYFFAVSNLNGPWQILSEGSGP